MEKKKSKLEILVIPVVITIVGIIGTWIITNKQIESTEKTIKSDQQIKIIEIFSDKITSKDINDRELAVRILGTLDTELSKKMMTAIAQSSNTDSLIRNIAIEKIDEIQRGYSYVIVGSFNTLDNAKVYIKTIKDKNMPYPIRIFNNGNNVFAVCIDGQLSYKEALKIKKIIDEKYKMEDTYIKSSKFWEEIIYE